MQINCDLGECLTPNLDAQIMPLIDMANIACGGHVGDVTSMRNTIALAKQHGVSIGAHPSYFDRANFGRVHLTISPSDLFASLRQQLTAFMVLCDNLETAAQYIKPHGALYHDMMHQPAVLEIICDVMQSINPRLKLVVQAGINSEAMMQQSKQRQIPFMYEAFADRGYRGVEMIPRTEAGALLPTAEAILAQVEQFTTSPLFAVDTLCFHSDHPPSMQGLRQLSD